MDITLPFPTKFSDDESEDAAIYAALQLPAPKISPLQELPLAFGRRWYDHFSLTQRRLEEEHGKRLEELARLAQMLIIFASTAGANFFTAQEGGANPEASLVIKKLSTPDGYLDYEGAAAVLDGQLAKIDQPLTLLKKTSFESMPNAGHILESIALCWFIEAASLLETNPKRAMEMLFDAMRASADAHGLYMWGFGVEHSDESVPSSRSAASAMAKQRHKENYALAETAIKYWRENIDRNLSASKAAEELLKVVPLSHKKLAELVSIEKKKINE